MLFKMYIVFICPAPIKKSLNNLKDSVDMIYITSDNLSMSASDLIIEYALKYNIPNLTGDLGSFNSGALVGIIFDYEDLGMKTGELILKIISNKNNVGKIPVVISEKTNLYLNKKIAEKLNIDLPKELISIADVVIE